MAQQLELTSTHAYRFRLGELRRDPRERAGQALKDYLHQEWEAQPENKKLLSEALGLG